MYKFPSQGAQETIEEVGGMLVDKLCNEELRERLGQKAMLSICMVQRRQGR